MKKVLNTLSTVAIIAGIVLVLGAAGASDCDTYTTTQSLTQVSVAAALLIGGIVTKVYIN